MRLFLPDPTPDDPIVDQGGQRTSMVPIGASDRRAMRERLGLTEEDLAELAADAWYEAGRND